MSLTACTEEDEILLSARNDAQSFIKSVHEKPDNAYLEKIKNHLKKEKKFKPGHPISEAEEDNVFLEGKDNRLFS